MTRHPSELPGQMALEGFADAPIIPVKAASTGKAHWIRFRPAIPVRCDDCVTVLAESHGVGPATRQARWRVTTKPNDLLLCSAHAQDRRLREGLTPLKEKR